MKCHLPNCLNLGQYKADILIRGIITPSLVCLEHKESLKKKTIFIKSTGKELEIYEI